MSTLSAILVLFFPLIKEIVVDVIKDYISERSHKVIEKTGTVITPEAVHIVYNPAEHISKYDRLLTED